MKVPYIGKIAKTRKDSEKDKREFLKALFTRTYVRDIVERHKIRNKNARLNFRQIEYSHLMENVIFNELLARDFSVDVGVVAKNERTDDGRERQYYEVDFVCTNGSQRYYIQSAYRMPDEAKVEQESASLLRVNDAIKKIIILREYTPVLHTENGITIISIFDFLMKENSLEL